MAVALVPVVLAGGEGDVTVTSDLTAALVAHPELIALTFLRDAGWRFAPLVENGELVGIDGFCLHDQGFTDAVRVRTPTEVTAVRADAQDRTVWTHTGPLAETLAELRTLPTPGRLGDPIDRQSTVDARDRRQLSSPATWVTSAEPRSRRVRRRPG